MKIILSVILLAMVLMAVWGLYHPLPPEPTMPTWVTMEETDQLRMYHGVTALKITENHVSIFRGGEWIVVLRRGK